MKKPMPSAWLVLVLVALLGAACAGEDAVEHEIEVQDSALAAYRFGEPLYVQDSGHYSRYVYRGWTSESFWIDLNVRNDSPAKEVGVLWTKDGWQTSTTTVARFEAGLGGGRERWGVDVTDFAGSYGGSGIEVEYAAYVKMNGQTYWSALRNHYIYQVVTPQKPVRLLRSSMSLDEAGVPVLTGAVRALNVPSARRVFVRYTLDGWQSFAEIEASFDGKDFAFGIPLSTITSSTEEVAFAARFEAEGEAHWDNNDGKDFRHQLAPVLGNQWLNPAEVAAAGYRALDAYVSTALPVSAVAVRIDGGEPVALASDTQNPGYMLQGFNQYGSIRYVFPVAGLSRGTHQITISVSAGPLTRTYAPLSFVVDDSIDVVASYPLDSSAGFPWDLDTRGDGVFYVSRETRVEKRDSLDAAAPSLVFESPVSSYLREVTVDPEGRVYAVATWNELIRWLPTGELDTSFGTNGVLALDGSYAGEALCYPVDIKALASGLYVLDSCNPRLLQLTFDGAFVSSLDLEALGYSFAQELRQEGDRLWLEASNYVTSTHELLGIDIGADGPEGVGHTFTLPDAGSLESFAVDASFVWTSDYSGVLELYTRDGTFVGAWFGGDGYLDAPGAASTFSALTSLGEGVVVGLDRGGIDLEVMSVVAQ